MGNKVTRMSTAHEGTVIVIGAATATAYFCFRQRRQHPRTKSIAAGLAKFSLREATAADIPVLRRLEQGVVAAERPLSAMIRANDDVPVLYYDLEQLIEDGDTFLAVVEERGCTTHGELVASGYLSLRDSNPSRVHQRHGYLGFMYVAPRLRGLGLNQLVMDRLIAWGQSRGVEHYYLDVYSDNAPAVRAYKKAGFSTLHYEMHAHFPAATLQRVAECRYDKSSNDQR
jgi:ribosomal protein S18 acetylase RimI-like enzyme